MMCIRYSLQHGAFLRESLGNYKIDTYICTHKHCDTQAAVMGIKLKSEQNTKYATYFLKNLQCVALYSSKC